MYPNVLDAVLINLALVAYAYFAFLSVAFVLGGMFLVPDDRLKVVAKLLAIAIVATAVILAGVRTLRRPPPA